MKKSNIIKSAGIVSACTLLSRGLGMIRDAIFAYFFGTSLLASSFYVAFKIPNLFRRLFGEGALSAALIPVLVEERLNRGEKAAWQLAAKVISLLLIILCLIALIGVIGYSLALHIPNLPVRWLVNFELSRIMFPYLLFICLAATAMAILNAYKRFALPAFAPSLLNIILIGTMGLFLLKPETSPELRIKILCWAVLFAGVAQLFIQLPTLKKLGFKARFRPDLHDPRVRKILMLMGPAALGAGITQINVLIDGYLAVWISSEAPAALFYSERLIYFPLGIIATALGTVLLPSFSTYAADEDYSAFSNTFSDALRHLLFIMAPAALGLLILAPFILQLIFEWGGSFNEQSNTLTSIALQCYAPGLMVFSLSKVFVPAFYSMQDTRTPVRIGIITVGVNLALNILFILTLPQDIKHAGMASATVLAEAFGVILLGRTLSKRVFGIQWKKILTTLLRALMASAVMAAITWKVVRVFMLNTSPFLPVKASQFISVMGSIVVGVISYLIITSLLRSSELNEIVSSLRKRQS